MGELAILLILFGMPLAAMYDLFRQSSIDKNKVLWALIILLIPFIGPLIYLLYTRVLDLSKK
ncbi:PLDc N-terminal domain-containing protein [Pedobacter sp.]|uniref:PLDc N-terminal domain-containing protein n=1 Tax=Pedobacter sp. TaxID=1411316 RepID=UPI0035670EB5